MVGLVLTLALVLVAPAPALAAKPVGFTASGIISEVLPGDIFPAGQSGRWVVDERQMSGIILGDINGEFTLTYSANVNLETQAGSFHGTIEVDSLLINVIGKSQLVGDSYPGPTIPTPFGPTSTTVRALETTGSWAFISGSMGNGDYYGVTVVLIAAAGLLEGHILAIDPDNSGFSMTGKWKP